MTLNNPETLDNSNIDIRIMRANVVGDVLIFLPDDVIKMIMLYDYLFTFKGKLQKTIRVKKDYIRYLTALKNNKFITTLYGDVTSSIIIWDGETGNELFKIEELGYIQRIESLNHNKVMIYYNNPNELIIYDTTNASKLTSFSTDLDDICILEDSDEIKFIGARENLVCIFSYDTINNKFSMMSFDVPKLDNIYNILILSYNNFVILDHMNNLTVFKLIRKELSYNMFQLKDEIYDIEKINKIIRLNNSYELLISGILTSKYTFLTIFDCENMKILETKIMLPDIHAKNILSVYNNIILFIKGPNSNYIEIWDNKLKEQQYYVTESGKINFNEQILILPNNSIFYTTKRDEGSNYIVNLNFEDITIINFKISDVIYLSDIIFLDNNNIVILDGILTKIYIYK